MKNFVILGLMHLMLNVPICFSQNQEINNEIDNAKRLGKDSIVQIALQLINKKIDINNYKVKVMANSTNVFVSFYTPIKYVPSKSVFYYSAGVNITEKTIVYSPVSNPSDYTYSKKNISFYRPTEKARKSIEFVVNAVNKSNEVGSIDIQTFDDNMIIREKRKYYDIIIISTYQESSYKIDKISGKIYDAQHAHLELLPVEEDDDLFEEIK